MGSPFNLFFMVLAASQRLLAKNKCTMSAVPEQRSKIKEGAIAFLLF